MDYKDLTISKYNKIKQASSGEEILEILAEKPLNDISINDLGKYSIEFLSTAYEPKMPNKSYIIKDRKFDVDLNVNKLSVSQYLDLQTFLKDTTKYTSNILACFLIPTGEKYGDSDPLEIADFLNENCSITVCWDINFFFFKLLENYTKTTQQSLEKQLKKLIKTEKNKQIKMMLIKKLLSLKTLQVRKLRLCELNG